MNEQKIKRPRGGISLSPEGGRTEAVQVRMPIADRTTARRAADKLGMTLAAFIRQAVKRRAGEVLKECAD